MLRNRNFVRIIVALAFLVLCAAPSILTQEKTGDSNIKVQAVNVVVDLIVTDRHGRHVQGLTAEDFKVYEDGVPQKIIGFTPSAGSATEPSSPAVASPDANAKPVSPSATAASPSQPHLLTVVLDLADNRPANTKTSSDAVLHYLDKTLGTGDYVAIYYIDQSLHMALPFTNNLEKARETLQRIETRRSGGTFSGSDRAVAQEEINDLYRQAHPETALGAVAGDLQGGSSSGGPGGGSGPTNNLAMMIDRQIVTMRTFLNMQNTFQARAVFAALRAICLAYKDMPGRKNVVLFSEGFLYSDDAKPEMEAVADAANRANVSIYVIDPEGVEINPYGAGSRPTDTIGSRIAAAGAPGSNVGQGGGESKFDKIRNVGNISRGDQLQWLADTTGGLMVKRTNDLLPAFSKVLDDGRDYYTLAYLPAKSEFDGKFHSIKIELLQHGHQLRYRKGYWATPRGQAVAMTPIAAQLIAGFQNGSMKSSSVPDVFADLLLAPDGHYTAPVSVSFPANRIPFEKDGQENKAAMTLILVARDSHKNLLSVSQRSWSVRLNDKEKSDFEKTLVTVRSQLPITDLQPVSIEAIIEFSSTAYARGGTTIDVPDPAAAGFRLTSILVSDRAEQATCNDPSDSLCFLNVRLRQPPKSRFPSSTKVIVYFAANELSLDPQTKKPRLGVAFTLKSGNEIVKTVTAENIQSLSGPSPNAVLVLAEYDLKSLRASEIFRRMLTQNPYAAEVHLFLAQAHAQNKEDEEALSEFSRALELNPKLPEAHYGRAMIHLRLGKLELAEEEFRAELVANPSDPSAEYRLGHVLLLQHKQAEAIELLTDVVRQKPNDADPYYELGKALLEKGDLKPATDRLETAVRLEPEQPYAYYQLSLAYRRQGRAQDAETTLRQYERLRRKKVPVPNESDTEKPN